jgi:hypothetical protein
MKNTLAIIAIHLCLLGILFIPDEKFQMLLLVTATVSATYIAFMFYEELVEERARKQTVINVNVEVGQ